MFLNLVASNYENHKMKKESKTKSSNNLTVQSSDHIVRSREPQKPEIWEGMCRSSEFGASSIPAKFSYRHHIKNSSASPIIEKTEFIMTYIHKMKKV